MSNNSPPSRPDWHCPASAGPNGVVTLGHGSGGLLTNQLLDEYIFRILGSDGPRDRNDAAAVNLGGPIVFSTDGFVVSPLFFPGGDIGQLAVNGTVNDVAMGGGMPEFLSLGFILEEGLSLDVFRDVLISVKRAAERAGVRIATGDTKVVERGKGDQVFIHTTGLGRLHPAADLGTGRLRAGDCVLVSGNLAAHGMAVMAVREGLAFESALESDTAPLNHTVKRLLDRFGNGVCLLRDPTRGGVGTALAEIARDAGLGIDLIQSALPMDQRVAAACELLGLDPLYVANEGVFLALVREEVAAACLSWLREDPVCQNAALIGRITPEHPGKVVSSGPLGGRRVVPLLPGELLPRIC